MAKHFGISEITLIDQNLLALQTAQCNLQEYGVEAKIVHAVFPPENEIQGIFVANVLEKQSAAAYSEFLNTVWNGVAFPEKDKPDVWRKYFELSGK